MSERGGAVRPSWLDLNAGEGPEDVALPVEVRVKQGMAALDAKYGPGWVDRIDVDTLLLDSACRCVLGQLHRQHSSDSDAYARGVIDLFGFEEDEQEEEAHGFVLRLETISPGSWSDSYYELTTTWRHAILARRLEQA